MPHNTFIERANINNSGQRKCSCGQAFNFASEKDMNMKLRMHCKFCTDLPEGPRQIIMPKKAVTLRERQQHEDETIRRVHENN